MFDLITGKAQHLPRHAALPVFVSTSAQAVALAAVFVLPLLFMTEQMPEVPTMMAFVAAAPAPPPPPPPPAPRAKEVKPKPQAQQVPAESAAIVPLEPPQTIRPEIADDEPAEGVPGGIEGGIPGGVVGGVLGGLPDATPPPPPPPPAPRGPVRIGGKIQAPALIHRVEPVYPQFAVSARIEGMVILEAIVERDGTVGEVKILRGTNEVLDREALVAVRQWRYTPLVLNGIQERFILTVTLSFHLQNPK